MAMRSWLQQQRLQRQKHASLKLAVFFAAMGLVFMVLVLFFRRDATLHIWIIGGVLVVIFAMIVFALGMRYIRHIHHLEEEHWAREEKKIRSILESIQDGYYELDDRGRFIAVNRALAEMLGTTVQKLIGTSYQEFVDQQDAQKLKYAFRWVAHTGNPVQQLDWDFVSAEGGRRSVEGSIVKFSESTNMSMGVRGMIRDVSERKRSEAMINHMAYHDVLTNLPNRRFFEDELTRALSLAQRKGEMMALLFLDLDRFKYINDSLGHQFGDRLLQELSDRLKESIGSAGTLARMGGDEFTMIFPAISNESDVIAMADRIIHSLQKPLHVECRECMVTTSIGISIFPRDGEDAQTLMKHADAAMYSAKEKGRNRYIVYSFTMSNHASECLAMEQELHKALERGEFHLQYQPQIDCQTGKIVGVEALLRWQHPVWGLISPAEFIPLAEETGLIVPIGEWALRTACNQAKLWEQAGYDPLRVAVNLSARQFQQENLVQMIQQVLQETDMQPELLELEITESVVMKNPDAVIGVLHELKRLGMKLSIDDFGTGYSSLSYLRDFPIDRLKIDRSFVSAITEKDDAVIAQSIIAMAHNLHLSVLAEGVENELQFAFLREQKCDEMQGYLYSKPLSAEEIKPWLQKIGQGNSERGPCVARKREIIDEISCAAES